MSANRTRRILTRILIIAVLSIGIAIFVFKQYMNNVYDNTIQPTSFQNVVLEKDTAENSTLPEKNLPLDSAALDSSSQGNQETSAPFSSTSVSSKKLKNNSSTSTYQSTEEETATEEGHTMDEIPANILPVKKGREIKSSEIPPLHVYNTRVRLTMFLTIFKQGDYISGMEFSNIYRRDPTLGKLAKSSICGFIEKNIRQLTRSGNSFVIQTIDPKGVHTRIKIPFVEDLQINIDNGAQLVIQDPFTSTAPKFLKSILLPIQLKRIDIVHNGEQFPTSGYVSGDFYFIDYSKTKMAYKIR